MIGPLLVLTGVFLLGKGYLERHPTLRRVFFGRDALPGEYVRLDVRVDPAFAKAARQKGQLALEDAVSELLRRGGWNPVVVGEDPTSSLFSVIASPDPRSRLSVRPHAAVHVIRSTPVKAPPIPAKVVDDPFLDPGLDEDEVMVIRGMLSHEKNPKHLEGLAGTLEEDFPCAALLLRGKAKAIEVGKGDAWSPNQVIRWTIPPHAPMHKADYAKVVKALSKYPVTRKMEADALAHRLKVPESVARVALATTAPGPFGATYVSPDALRKISFLPPPRMTLSALMLAHAGMRPVMSGVDRPEHIVARAKDIDRAAKRGDEKAGRAKDALRRATAALERKKWIDWTKRKMATET